jgi:acyl-coenzyme A thioesterase PaaI-like protein
MKPIPNPFQWRTCFYCGDRNPAGLKLSFQETETEPNEVVCRWTVPATYCGFGKIVHGGIQMGLFDEIMGWAVQHLLRQPGLTASVDVKFRNPLFVEQELEVRCRIESKEGPRITLAAEIRNQARTVCTAATGTYVLMEPELFEHLVGRD